jgi:NADH dehydrogenase
VTEASGRFLVTGANGHLGRRLLARLANAGQPARALVRSEAAADTLRRLPFASRFELRIADYRDPTSVTEAAAGCTRIVHLVGILKESRSTRYEDAHEKTASAIAEAAARCGAERIVYLSILGSRSDDPNACLASKGRAEEILLHGKVPATVLQVPMVLGPGDVAARALRGKALAPFVLLPRGGASLEQPIDAEDVVAAILAAFEKPELSGEVIALAGPESIPHRELVARAAALHGRRPRVVRVPLGAARLLAAAFQSLAADPPVTPAMLGVLDHDDAIDPAPACQRLGIRLTPLDVTLRRCVGPDAETT